MKAWILRALRSKSQVQYGAAFRVALPLLSTFRFKPVDVIFFSFQMYCLCIASYIVSSILYSALQLSNIGPAELFRTVKLGNGCGSWGSTGRSPVGDPRVQEAVSSESLACPCHVWLLYFRTRTTLGEIWCTFSTTFGRYQFLHLPFEIAPPPEVLRKAINEVFEGLSGTCVWGSSQEKHNKRLCAALTAASNADTKQREMHFCHNRSKILEVPN